MSPEKDFDISAWEAGANNHSAGEDFDIGKWEAAGQKASLATAEGAPKVQPPQVNMQEDLGPAPAGKLSSLPGVNPHTPTTQEGIGDVALAASPTVAPMVLALAPEAVQALASAAAAHPIAAKVIAHGLEAAGLGAGWKIATKLFGK